MTRAKSKKQEPKLDDLLSSAAKHLLNRILEPVEGDVMTVAEEAQAFKAVSSYYAMIRRLNPDDKSGAFSGHVDEIANLGGRGNPRNGADPFDEPDF